MNVKNRQEDEKRFDRGAWLNLFFAILLILYAIAEVSFRFTLPTDGWRVNESVEVGYLYLENWMGVPSGLKPGDSVIDVEGNLANILDVSPSLRKAWQEGATLDYTVIRDGEEIYVPVTLTHWQLEKWLLAWLRDPFGLAVSLSGYFLLALAFFVFVQRPRNPTAGAFLLFNAVLISNYITSILPRGWSEVIDPLANLVVVKIGTNIGLILFTFAFFRFALVFPHPKPILQRFPWLAFIPVAVGILLMVFVPYSYLGWYWFLLSLILSVAILLHNAFTMRDAVSRAQMLWGLGGLIFGFGLIILLLLASTFGVLEPNENVFNLVSAIAYMVMGIMLSIAILRYRLFDIDVIIRKTLIYGALTVTLALVFFGVVTLMQYLFVAVSGQQSAVSVVVSTLLIAALFTPLRRRIQNDIDRRFFRRKYDTEKVVAAFGASLRQELDLDGLQAQIVAIVEETLQPEQVSLWLKPEVGKISEQVQHR